MLKINYKKLYKTELLYDLNKHRTPTIPSNENGTSSKVNSLTGKFFAVDGKFF